jgi:ubiquitin-like protein Pup
MSEQEQIRKTGTRAEKTTDDVSVDNAKGEALKAELDELLDEIDNVLEENAEDFVRNYVQKGGE